MLCETTVYDDNGNNNNRFDPGETVDLTATLLNFGGADLVNLSTTIELSSPYISIVDNSGYYGSIPIDSTKENTGDPFVVSAPASTPDGHETQVAMIATADNGFIDTLYFTLRCGVSAPSDTGYYYSYYSGGPHPSCPEYNWIAIDTTQTQYPGTSLNLIDNQTETIDLPFTFQYYGVDYSQISICSNGWIAMGDHSDVDWTNSGIPNSDGPATMIAALWDDLDPGNAGHPGDVYYYYDSANHRFIVEYFQVEHWPSGYEETFEVILLDPNYYPTPTGDGEIIVQYANELQQVDNTLGIENATEEVGLQYFCDSIYHEFAIPITNEFAIKYTTWPPDEGYGVSELIPTASPAGIQYSVFPNITSGVVEIKYSVPDNSGEIGVSIFDATGRVVRSYDNMPSTQTISWDCTDNHDLSVSGGVYFVRLETLVGQEVKKVIVIE